MNILLASTYNFVKLDSACGWSFLSSFSLVETVTTCMSTRTYNVKVNVLANKIPIDFYQLIPVDAFFTCKSVSSSDSGTVTHIKCLSLVPYCLTQCSYVTWRILMVLFQFQAMITMWTRYIVFFHIHVHTEGFFCKCICTTCFSWLLNVWWWWSTSHICRMIPSVLNHNLET